MRHNYFTSWKNYLTAYLLLLLATVSSWGQITVQLGSGTSTTATTGGAGTAAVYNRYWESRRTQVIYTAAELNAAGVTSAANMTALALYIETDINGTLPNWSIKIKHTTATSFTAFDAGPFTTCYTNNETGTGATIQNWRTFTFSTPFAWNGVDNIVIDFCHTFLTGFNSTGVIRQYAGATNSLRSVISGSVDQCPTTTGGTNGSNKPQVRLTFFTAPPCSGTPPVTTASVTPTSACVASPINLSLTGIPFVGGLTYQWQYSTDGGTTWNNIAGATSASSTTSMPAVSAVFRCLVTCTNSAQTTPSTTTSAVSPTGAPTYATLPYTQNFEATWQSSACVTAPIAEDRPDNSWVNTPSSGNQSWRQDNRGAIASVSGWTFTGNGLYSPTGANGTSRSARFHSYGALSGTQGTLDLYVDLSSTTLNKVLSFYYINPADTYTIKDNLTVLISTNGGFSFTPLATLPANPLVEYNQWTLVTATITSNSPNTVIRFRATSNWGGTDLGIDEVSIIVPPDIEVRGIDNSVIPNGSVVTSLVNGTDFGTISVASTPFLDRTFTIANPGTQPLNISSVTSSNANFVIQTNPSSPVVAGTTTFTVRFQPTTFGTFNSTISIVNNVPGKTPYTFRVTGTATAPTIAVSGLGNNIPNNKTLTMASDGTFLGVGNNLTSTFTITNNGNENLAVNSITTPSGSSFSVSGAPSSVAANGGTANFNVSFNPANGAKIDTVIIRSNAANAPTFRFLVSAGGVVSALDLNDAELQISPNPSNGIFNLQINNPIYNNISAVVYDVSGRAVQTYQVPQFNGSMNIDLSRLEKGTYILLIETNGERVARKLIKQ